MNTSDWICYLECDGLTIDEISAWYTHVWFEGQFQSLNPYKIAYTPDLTEGFKRLR